MNLKAAGGAIALLASIAAIGSFVIDFSSIKQSQFQESSTPNNVAPLQHSSGPNSPNVANVHGDVTINIKGSTSKLDLPSYDFSLQPFPGWRRNPHLGAEFNKTMAAFLGKTVYLSVTLSEEMSKDVLGDRDEYGRLIFTVQNDADEWSKGGSEYLVHLSRNDENPFEQHDNVAVLSAEFRGQYT